MIRTASFVFGDYRLLSGQGACGARLILSPEAPAKNEGAKDQCKTFDRDKTHKERDEEKKFFQGPALSHDS